jgi:hypothetical protein
LSAYIPTDAEFDLLIEIEQFFMVTYCDPSVAEALRMAYPHSMAPFGSVISIPSKVI